jgi:hypothetical protein
MPCLLALVLVAAPVASPPARTTPLRLMGLDRLYFTAVGGAETVDAPPPVMELLPRSLGGPRVAPSPDETGVFQAAATDFRVPLPSWPRPVLLRQVVAFPEARINELWIALYDGGRRSDVWHFTALPSETDNKLLPNYWIEDVEAGPAGTLALRLHGRMARPQGAWWAAGRVVTLRAGDGALTVAHVRNAFGFIQGYDLGDDSRPPTLAASAEREVEGRFERRDLDPVPAEVLETCGTPEGLEGWDEMERLAKCLTRAPGAKTSTRSPQEPSFAERGGKPPEPPKDD